MTRGIVLGAFPCLHCRLNLVCDLPPQQVSGKGHGDVDAGSIGCGQRAGHGDAAGLSEAKDGAI